MPEKIKIRRHLWRIDFYSPPFNAWFVKHPETYHILNALYFLDWKDALKAALDSIDGRHE